MPKKFNVPVEGDRLIIPPVMGTGSIRRIALSTGLKLIVHRYKLNQDFILNRVGNDAPNGLVSVIFHSTAPSPNALGYSRIPGIFSKEQTSA